MSIYYNLTAAALFYCFTLIVYSLTYLLCISVIQSSSSIYGIYTNENLISHVAVLNCITYLVNARYLVNRKNFLLAKSIGSTEI